MEDGKILNNMVDEEDDLFEDAVSEEEEWVLARKGIQLVLNNRYDEAQKLFTDRKDSIQLAAGHCFVVFMNALMSFEEDRLAESLNLLRELEKRCAHDIGWLKSIRNKVFGNVKEKSDAARLEEQVILADTQVCLALLTFLQQDVSGCVRGGWVLRKAWKVYQHTYTQILTLYRQTFGPDSAVPGSDFPAWRVVTRSPSSHMVESPSTDWSVPNSAQATPLTPSQSGYLNGYRNSFANIFNSLSPTPQCGLSREDVSRLMAAVSFGYGVFQLCVSLLPPSLLKLIQVLGFGADREAGLEALMFARQGPDMRAPLATLALLWYHTIVRPFFALDGSNMAAGIETASRLVADSQREFSESALFLFFTGRIHRLMSDVPAALKAYLSAVNKSPQREVQLLCLHEVSWCYLIQLDWAKAYHSFMILKKCSRWSKIFYTYLAALCAGANDKLSEAVNLCQEIRDNLSTGPHPGPTDSAPPTSHTQLEHFISRRAALLAPAPAPTSAYCRLLAYEMLFLWNTLPATQDDCTITKDCQSSAEEEPMVGLRSLILGTVQGCVGLRREAVASLRAALTARQDIPDSAQDSHVTAFALYELARLLILEAREYKEEARSLLERAQRDFKGYDFESRLNVRIHAALRSLGH